MKNVLMLKQSIDGNRIKQGDQSKIRYALLDSNQDDLNLDGKKAIIYIYNEKAIVFKKETVVADNDIELVIDKIVPPGYYTLEVVVDDKYIFPSDHRTKIEITRSVLGTEVTEFQHEPLYEDIINYGISNNLFGSFKGEDGKSLRYEDLTDEQKTDLASYVPVQDIPDNHIIDVMTRDYVANIGELDVIFIDIWSTGSIYPLVFPKKSYDGSGDYENWKKQKVIEIKSYAESYYSEEVLSTEAFYKSVIELNAGGFFGFSRPSFPLYVYVEDEYMTQSEIFENNYGISDRLISAGTEVNFRAQLIYNGKAIEQNKLEARFVEE